MADNEGVRRRDVLKGIGLTGAAAGLATTNVVPVANEAQAQPATQSHAHAPAPARNDNTAEPSVSSPLPRRRSSLRSLIR